MEDGEPGMEGEVDEVGLDLLRVDMENNARRLARSCIPVTTERLDSQRNRKANQDPSTQELSSTGPAISAVKRGRSQRLMSES